MFGLVVFIFSAFLMLFLGSVVLVHGVKDRVNRVFFEWVVLSVAWMVSNYLETAPYLNHETRSWLLRTDFASAVLAAAFISVFVRAFINRRSSSLDLLKYAAPAAVFSALSYTPWILVQVTFNRADQIAFVQGWAFYLYAAAVIFYFSYPYVLLLSARRRLPEVQQAQIGAISKGLALTAVVAVSVNLFMQDYLPPALFRIGVYSVIFLAIGVAWAIVRHEFLRIRLVVVEMLLLGILATILAKVVTSGSVTDVIVNVTIFLVMLVLGFAMVRSFLNEERQRENLQLLDDHLEKSNQRLLELDDLKNTMLSVASHQLRGPLGGIRGYLTMMKEGDLGPVTENQREALAMNLNVLSRLLGAVETFLDIGALEAGKVNLRFETVALDEVLTGIVDEFVAPMRRKGLVLNYECQAKRPVLAHVDADKVQHIVFNIIDNAMKYTELGSVSVTLDVAGGEAVVKVADTGPGLSPADLSQLFHKFERGHFVTDKGGSGLGLYVVKMLTEMQHGRVQVESAGVGQGTVFSVTFPLAKKP